MTQHKNRISSDEASAIYRYFKDALRDQQLFPVADDPTSHYVMTRAFKPLMEYRGSKKDSLFINQLQAWVDTYINQAIWELCLKTIRDNRANKKAQLYTLQLPYKTYQVVRKYAKKAGVTIEQAIEQSARAEMAKLSFKAQLENNYSPPRKQRQKKKECETIK